MEFGGGGGGGDGVDVVGADAAAGQDDDPAGGLADEPREGEAAGEGVRLISQEEAIMMTYEMLGEAQKIPEGKPVSQPVGIALFQEMSQQDQD